MSSSRRSTRVQIQQAVAESLSDSHVKGHDDDAAPLAAAAAAPVDAENDDDKPSRKRPRDSKVNTKSSVVVKSSVELPEPMKETEEESDGIGDPDFGDSDEDDEIDSSPPELKRLKKKTESLPAIVKRDDSQSSGPVEPGSKTEVKEPVSLSQQSIPKKATGSIPRRKQNEPSQSLLLASLKPAPAVVTTTSTTTTRPAISSTSTVRKDFGSQRPHSSAAPLAPPASRAGGYSKALEGPPPPSSISIQGPPRQYHQEQRLGAAQGYPEASRHQGFGGGPAMNQHQVQPPHPFQQQQHHQLKPVERQAMASMMELCQSLRERDRRFQLGPIRSVDLGGSFLQRNMTEEERLDFFDKNERGEITLQPRRPMFPEDFPSGMKEHNLAWWGILDPAIANGRIRHTNEQEITGHSPAPPQPTLQTSPAGQDRLNSEPYEYPPRFGPSSTLGSSSRSGGYSNNQRAGRPPQQQQQQRPSGGYQPHPRHQKEPPSTRNQSYYPPR